MTTVLVVDDDLVERESMAATLEAAGYEVLRAESATGALRVALRTTPHVVVMDLVLPDFHGTEAARAIRSVAGLTNVPIVAVTHHLRTLRELEPATFGAECILHKPVLHQELLDAVERCLAARRMTTPR
jgi:CheY-like chemotaxis protein